MPTSSLTRPRTVATPVETPSPAPDPYGLNAAQERYITAQNAPVEPTSRLKAFGKMAMYGLGQIKPGRDWSDVAAQAGSALGAGISGAIQPKLPGAVQKLYNVQKAEEDLGTAQKLASTAALANYRNESIDIRRDSAEMRREKMAMDQEYREWQKKDKTRLTDNTINRTKFLQDYMKHKQVTTDAQNAFMNAYREKTLLERMRQFNANDEIKRAQLMVSQARQKTYEQSVANGLTTAQAKVVAEAAEGQALLDAADDYDDLLEGLDPKENYDEILQIKRDQRRARREGQAKIAASQAAGEVRGTPAPNTMPMTSAPSAPVRKPKNDPDNLFQ